MAALQYKDDHNRIAYLGRERGSEDFTDILSGQQLHFAQKMLGPHDLVATIACRRRPKAGSGINFPSSMPQASVCLSTGRVYNFSRFILEGMIANVKTKKNKFLMYPRFLQMLVAIETADRTPRPTSAFTRKLFSNMRLKWAGVGNTFDTSHCLPCCCWRRLLRSKMLLQLQLLVVQLAHPTPHSPLFSPVRESSPERQPETEWVVPNPVSPGTDWRPWPSVPPPRTPTPPAQTLSFEEPLVSGPVPKPAGYVDPDTIDPIIFGPPPRPYDFLDHSGDSRETHVWPEDAATTTAMLLHGWWGDALATEGMGYSRSFYLEGLSRSGHLKLWVTIKLLFPLRIWRNAREERFPLRHGLVEALMMQVGTNPALARELLGADVNEDNFIERMTAIKERKKRALADLRYRALKGKPLKHSEVTQMMRTLVKNQWCAAHNGTITMKAVKAMSKQQLIDNTRISADVFKRSVSDSPQPSNCSAATTQPADDHDSAGGSSFHPAGSATPMSGSAVPDTAGDSDDSSSPHRSLLITYKWMFVRYTPGVLCSGAGVWFVDKLPDDEMLTTVKLNPFLNLPLLLLGPRNNIWGAEDTLVDRHLKTSQF
ncbi:hypothetical protein Tco_0017028 [Tanacetum coccineum]